jgi:hypothetical protein
MTAIFIERTVSHTYSAQDKCVYAQVKRDFAIYSIGKMIEPVDQEPAMICFNRRIHYRFLNT